MHPENDYTDGLWYELLIRRAFNYEPGHSWIGLWSDTFGKVHKKVEAAIDKFLTLRINKIERESLLKLKTKLRNTYSKKGILQIINDALEVTHRHKEYRPEKKHNNC